MHIHWIDFNQFLFMTEFRWVNTLEMIEVICVKGWRMRKWLPSGVSRSIHLCVLSLRCRSWAICLVCPFGGLEKWSRVWVGYWLTECLVKMGWGSGNVREVIICQLAQSLANYFLKKRLVYRTTSFDRYQVKFYRTTVCLFSDTFTILNCLLSLSECFSRYNQADWKKEIELRISFNSVNRNVWTWEFRI
jgi:hypothetical protein